MRHPLLAADCVMGAELFIRRYCYSRRQYWLSDNNRIKLGYCLYNSHTTSLCERPEFRTTQPARMANSRRIRGNIHASNIFLGAHEDKAESRGALSVPCANYWNVARLNWFHSVGAVVAPLQPPHPANRDDGRCGDTWRSHLDGEKVNSHCLIDQRQKLQVLREVATAICLN
jgi:hypothetical protein